MSCSHVTMMRIRTSSYTGSVAAPPYTDENRAAHGCICVRVQCAACGAERSENRNGAHIEVSPWGPTREERSRLAALAQAEVQRITATTRTLSATMRRGDRTITLRIADAGDILADGDAHTQAEAIEAIQAWPAGLAAATRLARAVVTAESLRAEVR